MHGILQSAPWKTKVQAVCKFPNCHAWMNNGLLMEQVILGVSDVSSWLLWTFLSCKDSPIDTNKKSRVSAKFLMPYLFADVTVRGIEGYKCHRSKTTSNQQIEAEKKHEKMWTKAMYFICSHIISKHPPILCSDGFESSYRTREHWKQSGKGAEPIPWSPIIRCARPWRETRAQSAINKGAWEGRIVTVTKMFSDRHLASYETCPYHRGKSKTFFQPLVGMLWGKEL